MILQKEFNALGALYRGKRVHQNVSMPFDPQLLQFHNLI